MRRVGRVLYILLILFLIAVITVCGVHVGQFLMKDHNEKKAQRAVTDMVKNVSAPADDDTYSFTHEAWDKLYAINPDLIGYMAFDDGFVEEPIVKCEDNEYYLRRWIDGTYNDMGTVFVDANNSMEDTNITIYGHTVYYDEDEKFSPLTTLVEQEAYDAHHEFRIWYKDHVTRYVITQVYYYNSDVDYEFNFKQSAFTDKEDFNHFLQETEKRNLIDGAAKLEYGDKMVTLQMCRKYYDSERIIVVCKAVEDKEY